MTAKFAYFLGWMYSDGCITFDRRCDSTVIKIKILKSDEPTLRLFSDITNWNFTYEKDRYVTMRKNSNKLAEKLIEYGVLPKKSNVHHLALRRPKQISDEYMPYFIRGYFDGNGYYTWENKKNYLLFCGCCGKCPYLLKDFQHYLEEHDIKSKVEESRPAFYRLRIRTRQDVKKFADLIFKDNLNLVLSRKYEKIKIFLENYHTTKELQSIAAKRTANLTNEARKKACLSRMANIRAGKTMPSMLGKHHSEETKRKISQSHKAHHAQVKRSELLETPEGNITTTEAERLDVKV